MQRIHSRSRIFSRITRLWVAAVVFGAGFAAPLATTSFAQDYQLVWSDEFDGSSLDLTKWEPQIGTGCPSLCSWGNNELQYYRAENATVAGGFLTIEAKEQAFGGRSYTSARLRTQDLADFTYGRFEMRAKLPIGQGLWPAFWMLSTNSPYGGWPVAGEIDIMEYLGNAPADVFGTIHYGNPNQIFASSGTSLASGTFNDDFHTFGIEWDPFEIRWYLDGVLYACNSFWVSSGGPYPAPFDQPFHMLLNLAVGGNLPGPPDGTTVFPQELVVDWVRVSQKPVDADCCVVFDGMDHTNPFGNGWFQFSGGGGGGGIDANTTDLPPDVGCRASLQAGYGGPGGFMGGFGRTNPVDLTDMTHFEFWINPDAGQNYTLEINLQEDDNGDNATPGSSGDDEWQYNLVVGGAGSEVVSGAGWQQVSIPLDQFYLDTSFLTGGNGVLDPFPTSVGGNGQLINMVIAIIGTGTSVTFRTDDWRFVKAAPTAVPIVSAGSALQGVFPNPFSGRTQVEFRMSQAGALKLSVFDVRGRLVRRLVDGSLPVGPGQISWDGKTQAGASAAAGTYFIQMESAGRVESRKVVLQR